MAAISVSMFEPTLGKLNQAQNLLKEGLEILTSIGARGQVVSLVRGGVPNTLGILSEFQDVEAYGAGLDRIFSDEGFQQFMARAQEFNGWEVMLAQSTFRRLSYVFCF